MTSFDANELFRLDSARQNEAQRRLMLLGDLANERYDRERFLDRSRDVYVPVTTLLDWHAAFKENGEDGLLPDWQQLDPGEQEMALTWLDRLGPYVDVEVLTAVDVAELAKSLGRSFRTAQRALERYRIGGLWGLTPRYNPLTPRHRTRTWGDELPRDMGTFDEATLEIIYRRRDQLGSLADKEVVSDAEVRARAITVGISPRTLWQYLRNYRKYGYSGLAPKVRSDKGMLHGVSDEVTELIRAVRLTNPDWSVRAVFEMVHHKAMQLRESPPSLWQVRKVLDNIPKATKAIADGRLDEFRNKSRITYPLDYSGAVVYQIDHCKVDVLVYDKRQSRNRRRRGEVRPWLTMVMERTSRYVVCWSLAYDQPYRHTVAGAIRGALLADPGGVPREIWVDNGKDLIANHVRQLTRELEIKLHICDPHQPQQRGILERMFGTLNTRLWATLPGYVASNTVDRNPSVRARLTIQELGERLDDFLKQYHAESHASLGLSPTDYWTQHCLAMPVQDLRLLDMLLKEPARRRVGKTGIQFGGRHYWHTELAPLVNTDVFVRVDTRFEIPDEIEVFYDGHWLCTAFATDSERGRSVTREEIACAQSSQMSYVREELAKAQAICESVEEKIQRNSRHETLAAGVDKTASDQSIALPIVKEPSPPSPKKSQPKEDFLSWMDANVPPTE